MAGGAPKVGRFARRARQGPPAAAAALVAVLALGAGVARAAESARPWIGVAVEEADRGVRIKGVLEATPAARAGLRVGDLILAVDGAAVARPAELISRIGRRGVGDTAVLRVARGRGERSVSIVLEPRPDDLALARGRLLGKPAPDFDLAESIGGPVRLSALAGHVVVVEFWATWCGSCRASLPRVAEWRRRYGGRGLRVVGISSEPLEVLARFVAERKIGWPIGRDVDEEVSGRYLVPAIPMMVVVDRAGVVRHVEVGGGRRLDAVEAAFVPLLGR